MKQQLNPASLQCMCEIRPPKPGDCDKMANLAGQLGYECTGTDVQARLDEMWGPNQYAVYVAELPGGQIADGSELPRVPGCRVRSFREISGLIVDQQIRSRGIGKALLDVAEQWCATMVAIRFRYTRMLHGSAPTDSTRATDTGTSKHRNHSARVFDQSFETNCCDTFRLAVKIPVTNSAPNQ